MISKTIKRDREKVFANSKTIIILLLLFLSVISAVILMPKQELNEYDLTPQDSSVKYTLFSNNDLSEENISVLTEDSINERIIIDIQNDRIHNATFNKANLSTDFTLFLDTDIKDLKIENYDTAKAYAIDPEQIDFENATFIINATGKQLYKCVEWNFTKQECYGTWKKVMNLVPGETYELLITRQDPGFIETNQSEFDLGTYNKTFYNASIGAVQLNISHTNGTYTSKIFNAGSIARWNNISWTSGGHYGQELPNNQEVETGIGGANMTGNVGLWHLNDGNGATNFYDGSGNNKNGTCSGANCSTWTTSGKFGGAFSFDGNDRIGTSINTQFNDFAVEVWFKDDGDNRQYERLADKSYTQCFWLGRNNNNPNSWGGGIKQTGNPYGVFVTLEDEEWHQIVIMRKGTTQYIYGDGGKVIAIKTGVPSTPCDATTFAIGAWGDSDSTQQRFTGIIDEVSIYNRSLTPEEILNHYKRGITRLNLTIRSCDDESCSGETWNQTYMLPEIQNLNIDDNRYFQYKAEFFTEDQDYSPELYNVTVNYEILDNIPPLIELTNPENDTINTTDKSPLFEFIATDETAQTLTCSIWMNSSSLGLQEKATNTSVINGTTTLIRPEIPLANDNYEWWINCSDGINTNISEKRNIEINVPDTSPPEIELISPENNTINTTNNTPEFKFIPTDDLAGILLCDLWLEESISGIANDYGSSSVNNGTLETIIPDATLSNQNYTWWINCSDGANTNISEKRYIEIYVDTQHPNVTLINPNNNSADFGNINFTGIITDDIELKNVSLFSNFRGFWELIETKNISGANSLVSFEINVYPENQFINKNFIWNLQAYDNTSKSNLASENQTFSNWDLGDHQNTIYNNTLNALTLNNYSKDGTYTSQVFDAREIVAWKNISWNSNAINIEAEIDYFNNNEAKNYYSQNTYSVRHWYNISGIISDFSQIQLQSVFDCDGICSGPINIRIGNSTSWKDYEFINSNLVRTDATTTDYTYYNNTFNISKEELGDYFFVQLLIYTGQGTIKFLMDESGPAGPNPQYRSNDNGDGSPAGWIKDNGDYAMKIKLLKNTNLNLSFRSCSNSDCLGEQWSENLEDSNFSKLSLQNNQHFQYKVNLESTNLMETPKLFNVIINYGEPDSSAPIINLISPNFGVGDNGNITTFVFNVTDDSGVDNCKLIINNEIKAINYSITRNEINEFNIQGLSFGTYNWKINCTDINGNEGSSSTRTLTIIPSYEYSGQTTDFSQVNIESIENLIIENPTYGLINFTETVNLSGGANINSYVTISDNLISIDSVNVPALNKSARLTLYNLNFEKPTILKNSLPCSDCSIVSYNSNLTFIVQGFSSYTASENSQLSIWDDSDSSMQYKNNLINFYANYTNTTSGAPINGTGIYCNISFSDIGTLSMVYDGESSIYTYNRTFSSAGVYYFNITCDDTNDNYASLNATDYASINEFNGPISPANITVIKSERANLSAPPAEISVQAGNLTQLTITASTITKSWQGYYGQAGGTIYLKDGSGSTFYNWNITSPKGEIYATRAIDVNFATVSCSNSAQIATEEEFIGQQPNDADSVRNTFNKNTHTEFNVGSVTINANTCNATNLYVNSSAQDNNFFQVLLSDGASNMIYTAIIDADKTGFDNQTHDFQMLVGENGRDESTTTTYYFFVEII